MQMTTTKNALYTGADGRESLFDLEIPANWNNCLVVFLHGYKGFKDWGCWNLVQQFFVAKGYGFLKYNVSHNGGTIGNPIDFPDLEAFADNAYSKEVKDFDCITDHVLKSLPEETQLYLIGHSRGGGIALLQSKHPKVVKIATWAAISDIGTRFPQGDQLKNWKETGVYTVKNGRTGQDMPHSYSQYLDYQENKDRLNIEYYSRNSNVPICVIHGEDDPAVKIEEGEKIAEWTGGTIIRIPNEQHTFGSSHPWKSEQLPEGLKTICEYTYTFFETN